MRPWQRRRVKPLITLHPESVTLVYLCPVLLMTCAPIHDVRTTLSLPSSGGGTVLTCRSSPSPPPPSVGPFAVVPTPGHGGGALASSPGLRAGVCL